MNQPAYKGRLNRLLKTGLCSSENIQEHLQELKKLTKEIDEEDVRKRSYQLKALADPTRLKVIYLLKNRAMCTCEIMAALNLTEPNASHHLNLLERNGIVRSQKTGKWVFYKLNQTIAETILRGLMG